MLQEVRHRSVTYDHEASLCVRVSFFSFELLLFRAAVFRPSLSSIVSFMHLPFRASATFCSFELLLFRSSALSIFCSLELLYLKLLLFQVSAALSSVCNTFCFFGAAVLTSCVMLIGYRADAGSYSSRRHSSGCSFELLCFSVDTPLSCFSFALLLF